jgi:hypothetical protein
VKEYGVIRRFRDRPARVVRSRFPAFLSIVLTALSAYSPGAFSGVPSLDDGRGDPLIRIVALSPVTSTRLALGATVTLEATAAYILHDKAGKVALVVSDDSGHILAETSTDVREGRGETTLRLPFVVPSSKMLTVKAFLATTDLKPFARDSRAYTNIFAGPVVPGGEGEKRKGK